MTTNGFNEERSEPGDRGRLTTQTVIQALSVLGREEARHWVPMDGLEEYLKASGHDFLGTAIKKAVFTLATEATVDYDPAKGARLARWPVGGNERVRQTTEDTSVSMQTEVAPASSQAEGAPALPIIEGVAASLHAKVASALSQAEGTPTLPITEGVAASLHAKVASALLQAEDTPVLPTTEGVAASLQAEVASALSQAKSACGENAVDVFADPSAVGLIDGFDVIADIESLVEDGATLFPDVLIRPANHFAREDAAMMGFLTAANGEIEICIRIDAIARADKIKAISVRNSSQAGNTNLLAPGNDAELTRQVLQEDPDCKLVVIYFPDSLSRPGRWSITSTTDLKVQVVEQGDANSHALMAAYARSRQYV